MSGWSKQLNNGLCFYIEIQIFKFKAKKNYIISLKLEFQVWKLKASQ